MAHQRKQKSGKNDLVIGMAVGAASLGALYFLMRKKEKHSLTLDSAHPAGNLASLLEEHGIQEPAANIKSGNEKNIASDSATSSALDWVMAGIQIWKKLKQ